MNNSIILLSGGLDSLVALGYVQKHTDLNIELALTFDYGQKAIESEISASKKICEYFSIKHKIIKLDWLKEITKTSLVSDSEVPKDGFENKNSAEAVWVPNRNALFLNIAACYCESYDIDYIVFGANKEESGKFSDNKPEYVEITNQSFKYSTQKHPEVIAPCCNMNKVDLVNYMIENNISFELIKSCYQNIKNTNKKHCAQCMSCKLLYNAIMNSKKPELIKEIF